MTNQQHLQALATRIVEVASEFSVDHGERYAEDLGPNSDPGLAREWSHDMAVHHVVSFSDYVVVLGVYGRTLHVGVVPQSRDFYAGPHEMTWSDGWQETQGTGGPYYNLSEIAEWIVRAMDY